MCRPAGLQPLFPSCSLFIGSVSLLCQTTCCVFSLTAYRYGRHTSASIPPGLSKVRITDLPQSLDWIVKARPYHQHCWPRLVWPLGRSSSGGQVHPPLYLSCPFSPPALSPPSPPCPCKAATVPVCSVQPYTFLNREMLRRAAVQRNSIRFCFWFSSKMFFLARPART